MYPDPYANKDILFVQAEEHGLKLFTVTDGRLDIITASWAMWDAILPHIAKQRAEIEEELKALPGNTDQGLRKPLFSEISFKDFPGGK
jgi:hypothetical protein